MHSPRQTEHFVTLFDSRFMPQGLCLHQSLLRHGASFHLWILAMDTDAAQSLRTLALPHVSVIELGAIENERLLSVKQGRSAGEYCWTLTPFVIGYVLDTAPEVERVTYLDADLFFFDDYASLIDELEQSGKHVLLTEHAFAPEYQENLRYGRFCVQFMTFRNTEEGHRILGWWQDRCAEWCFARLEDGKFGDQKYLDDWPVMFGNEVHLLERSDRTVAPWNVAGLSRKHGRANPVFFHFHGLRVASRKWVLLHIMYRVGRDNKWIYDEYCNAIRDALRRMEARGIVFWPQDAGLRKFRLLSLLKLMLEGRLAIGRI